MKRVRVGERERRKENEFSEQRKQNTKKKTTTDKENKSEFICVIRISEWHPIQQDDITIAKTCSISSFAIQLVLFAIRYWRVNTFAGLMIFCEVSSRQWHTEDRRWVLRCKQKKKQNKKKTGEKKKLNEEKNTHIETNAAVGFQYFISSVIRLRYAT